VAAVFLADFTLGNALLLALELFFFVIWIWILITILSDLFNDHEESGWAKAGWCLFLVIVPFLGSLVYLIARGQGMRDRAIKHQAEIKKHFDMYVRETAGTPGASPVDELTKLTALKEKGAISDEDFEKMKAKLVG
jgi:hypothetical protein